MTLSNGVEIPIIGFGTWQTPDGNILIRDIKQGIRAGYRLFDTASLFKNEVSVGQAVRECGVPREQIFVTTKLWNTDRGYDSALRAFDASFNSLGLEYIDLYLIHWPDAKNPDVNIATWRALEKVYNEKRVRAIGVSNFLPHHLDPLFAVAEVPPMVDQIEFHPGYLQLDVLHYCREHDMVVEGWSPLGNGKVLQNPIVEAIARNYHTSPAQVCIKWSIQHGVIPLPKSTTPVQMYQNLDLDFTLTDQEMFSIDCLPVQGGDYHPDKITF